MGSATKPYEPLYMTTLMWQAVPPAFVVIASLIFTQDIDPQWVEVKDPMSSECGDPFPHVVEQWGILYVVDGSHRIQQRRVRGATHTVARVLRELGPLTPARGGG